MGEVAPEGIPIIDLSPLMNHDTIPDPSAMKGLVKEIASACKEWGCFQVVSHGVPFNLRQRIFGASKDFFAQSLEEKKKVSIGETNYSGYHDAEHTRNVKDWKEVFDVVAKDPSLTFLTPDENDDRLTQLTSQYPEYPPGFRDVLEEFIQEMEKLAYKLMGLIALSLGLDAKRFEEFYNKGQTSFLRLLRYPPCPHPHLVLGVGGHKDAGLTILAQDDVGGLEVIRKTDHQWVSVKPTPDTYIILIGDTIQVWSNDAYESVDHRVILNSEKERFSIPYFFFPAHDTIVKPLEELVNEQNPAKYRPYIWGKFHVHRKETNFKKHKQNVENIQIHHYKIA